MDRHRKEAVEKSHEVFSVVLKSDIDILRSMIEDNGPILEEKTEEGLTSLHVAVICSKESYVDLLLNCSSDVYSKDVDGKIPLHWASYRNVSFSIFEKLSLRMTDGLETKDVYGRTPLHYICMNQSSTESGDTSSQDIHELIKKLHFLFNFIKNIDSVDYEGNTALHLLCEHIHNCVESEEINRKLIPKDLAAMKSRSVCGFILEIFLDKKANIFVQNDLGIIPLHLTCQNLCVEMIRILLSQGSVPTQVIETCDTAPMSMVFSAQCVCQSLAYKTQHTEWLDLSDYKSRFEDSLRPVLKSMKSSVNKTKRLSGSTALHQAVMDIKCSSNVVKGLIEYAKAEVNVKNFLGKTPLHYVLQGEIVLPSPLREEVVENWRRKVDLLLQHGADINSQDLFGFSPLHDAALYGELDFLRILVQNKANVYIRNKHGATPIHLLSINERSQLDSDLRIFDSALELLLKAGVDIDVQDLYGSSALHYAVNCGNEKIALKLLQKGINKELQDVSGLNACDYCFLINRVDFEKFMTEGIKQFDERVDCYLETVHIKNVQEWLLSNVTKMTLSDEKITHLLQLSHSSKFSNDISENIVLKQILGLMESVFNEVEHRDPRFKVTMELSGSTREGTKVDAPDEFDILCFLDNFESLCDIEESTGTEYVKCRRGEGKGSQSFNEFFDKDNFLMENRISKRFYLLIKECLGSPSVWKSASGLSGDKQNFEYPSADDLPDILCLHFRYTDAMYKELPVSCDIVPVIRQKNWWPSFAKQEGGLNSSEIIENGCMVMCVPRKHQTFSCETVRMFTHFKTSVYLSECCVMQSLPKPVIHAYKLAKLILKQKHLYPPLSDISEQEMKDYEEQGMDLFLSATHPAMQTPVMFTSYEIKNALFYELDTEQPEYTNEDVDIQVTREWTARIFKRLYLLTASNNFPTYFLPIQPIIKRPEKTSMEAIECMFCRIITSILDGKVWNEV